MDDLDGLPRHVFEASAEVLNLAKLQSECLMNLPILKSSNIQSAQTKSESLRSLPVFDCSDSDSNVLHRVCGGVAAASSTLSWLHEYESVLLMS